ncbi:Serpin B9 [Thelohanellus kitauei]|uniref:Serpin B9 n=1 Tax=Thelohanellus kitauei TaxID=669202 RepID=A0A0C2MRX5_THEKT|nr:Serpin B9 [Thelohanellus kitauei]
MSYHIVNGFNYQVFNHLFQTRGQQGNVAFSGVSLYSLLAVISVGLRGRTGDQVSKFLNQNFSELYDESTWMYSGVATTLKSFNTMVGEAWDINNILFHSFGVKDHFQKVSKELFNLTIEQIDFFQSMEAMEQMNQWVAEKTGGLIRDLFKIPPSSVTMLVFINTLLFQANWLSPFELEHTKQETFTDDQGQQFTVEMMNKRDSFRIFQDLDNHIDYLFIPFSNRKTYAVISLPHNGHSLENIMKNAQFEISTSLDMISTLNHFGVIDLFTPSMADLSGITSIPGFITDLFQVSTFVVDEIGARASASSAGVDVAEGRFRHIKFFANKPFIIHIFSSESKVILFSVAVTNPNI